MTSELKILTASPKPFLWKGGWANPGSQPLTFLATLFPTPRAHPLGLRVYRSTSARRVRSKRYELFAKEMRLWVDEKDQRGSGWEERF